MDGKALLKAENVCKYFGPTKAVDGFSMEIAPGTVHGLIGENGSGKSTFSAVAAGILQPGAGSMALLGEAYAPRSAADAVERGVSVILQEIATVDAITVAANIFLNQEHRFARGGFIRYKKMYAAAEEVMRRLGIEGIRPETPVKRLNLEERKLVEIAKAMASGPRLLIVDETSNALTKTGRDVLYSVVQGVKAAGGAVLFITHDMEELCRVCDTVTIMRDGRYVKTLEKQDMQPPEMKALMVGRELAASLYRADTAPDYGDEVVLEAKGLCGIHAVDISFQLHRGEILGIGGLSDCGMHELGQALFGLEGLDSGSVTLLPEGTEIRRPIDAIQGGVGYLSKNRDTEALIVKAPIRDNICLPVLGRLMKKGFIFGRAERAFSRLWAKKLSIKCRDVDQFCAALSGGNKQKVVLAKWLGNDSRILIMDCPTRGIDIGVKEAIYQIMQDMKREGRAIIMISEELPELIGMSDRILVMKQDSVAALLDRSPEITERQLINHMI